MPLLPGKKNISRNIAELIRSGRDPKQCNVCKMVKDSSEFHQNKAKKDGLNNKCKACNCLKAKEYNKNVYKTKNAKLKKIYGITIEHYNELFQKQNGCCAICNKPEITIDKRTKKLRGLAVDHNHKTGEIRGLLCSAHNRALGMFHDDINELLKAIEYLEKRKLHAIA